MFHGGKIHEIRYLEEFQENPFGRFPGIKKNMKKSIIKSNPYNLFFSPKNGTGPKCFEPHIIPWKRFERVSIADG